MEENRKGSHYDRPSHSGNKDNTFSGQLRIVFQSFFSSSKTMFQVEKETGISRSNVCRYVAMMEESGVIKFLYKGYCPISGYMAGFYSTDRSKWVELKPNPQLSLFTESSQPTRIGNIMRKEENNPESLSHYIPKKGGDNGKN
ncbi:MAG: hypothetical protein ACRCUJ_06645 [Phocaeicola sp.]